jgi:tubulin polyglutamylase TTLL6/13
LTRDFESIEMKAGEQYVVQRYMHKPYLIDGLKFDMRIYVLVYGIDPLRVFVFREGLARFATEEYVGPQKSNLDNLYMHLTNYAINKKSEAFEANEDSADDDVGHKRSVSSVFKLIEENEKDKGVTAESLWADIDDIAIKTLISAQPTICHSFKSLQPDDLENSMCFEILGIDIFIDDKLKPWLIEINSLPSFATDSPLDKKIKYDVVYETIAMLNMNQKRKRRAKREKTLQFERR